MGRRRVEDRPRGVLFGADGKRPPTADWNRDECGHSIHWGDHRHPLAASILRTSRCFLNNGSQRPRGHPVLFWQGPRNVRYALVWDAHPRAARQAAGLINSICAAAHKTFGKHAFSSARNVSFHRTGYPLVEAKITGLLGVTYIGSPVESVPVAESPRVPAGDDPALLFAATQSPTPVQPTWQNFTLDGKPLFAECQAAAYGKSSAAMLARSSVLAP
jgi:hypothetical protein